MLGKILAHVFHDPHTLFALFGLGIVFTPEFIEDATLWAKLIGAVLGIIIMFLTGWHKWLQIKNERANGNK